MTCKTGHMSVRLSVQCRHFQNPKAPNRWAEFDEIWHVYSMGCVTKRLGSGIFNFDPCAAWGTPNLAQLG